MENDKVEIHGIEVLKRAANQPDTTNGWNLELRTLSRISGSLIDKPWNNFTEDEPDTKTEVWKFYNDTTLVCTITLNYFDSTKARLVSGSKA